MERCPEMPFKTKYGKHYHMTEGCHGATIPCDTGGLSPCSDCCDTSTKGQDGRIHGRDVSTGPGSPLSRQGEERDDHELEESPVPSEADGALTITAEDLMRDDLQISNANWEDTESRAAPEVSLDPEPSQRNANVLDIEGLDYSGKGKGWRLRQRGRKYDAPWGGGYESLTRKQAGIVYGAVKRGDVTLDQRHTREMYNIVGVPRRNLDLHERVILSHIDAAVGHIVNGRMELAQAELDGHYTSTEEVVIGTRQVEVTEDNWFDFAFEIDHDYEIGDIAEEEVTKTVWRISKKQSED